MVTFYNQRQQRRYEQTKQNKVGGEKSCLGTQERTERHKAKNSHSKKKSKKQVSTQKVF